MSLLAPLALFAGLSSLSLELSAPQTAVLVGEPVKVVVRWKATADVPSVVVEDAAFLGRSLQFALDDGSGVRRYSEFPRQRIEQIIVGSALAKGKEVVSNYVLLRGGFISPGDTRAVQRFVFPVAGQYSLKALYVQPGTQNVLSETNAIAFTVSAPTGDEAAVLNIIRAEPRFLDGRGDLAQLKALVHDHPGSRYLLRAKISLFEERAADLQNRRDPDTGQSLWRLDDAALAAFRATQYRNMAQDIWGDANWGPFEEERLNLAMIYGRAGGAVELATQARTELLQHFPTSLAAAGVREWDAQMTEAAVEDRETAQAPKLEVTAPKSVILVREPLVVSVAIEAQGAMRLDSTARSGASALRFLIDRGSGFAPYLERTLSSGWRVDRTGPLFKGRADLEFVLGDDELRGGPAFDHVGTYRIAVEYRSDSGDRLALSDSITVRVKQPPAGEQFVLQAILALRPDVFSIHEAEPLGRLARLEREHRGSPYLQEAKLNDLRFRLARVQSGYDPSLEDVPARENLPAPDVSAATLRQRYALLIETAADLEKTAEQFAPDAALILARLYEGIGDATSARDVYNRILRSYPGRQAARFAAERVEDAKRRRD
jgi:hypothetical protein